MKTTTLTVAVIYSVSAVVAFISTYFFNLAMTNSDQYLALVAVVMTDGFFGVIAGTKNEGFKTFKALKVLRTLVVWIMFLTVLLVIEKGFPGTGWLSETILLPFIIFQLVSALKNASMLGLIEGKVLLEILDKIDLHKGLRNKG
jgi:phage-related holin